LFCFKPEKPPIVCRRFLLPERRDTPCGCNSYLLFQVMLYSQRLALAAVDWSVDSPSKRKKLKATQKLKKRAAHPSSAARIVGQVLQDTVMLIISLRRLFSL
jgi:hypothetical protein